MSEDLTEQVALSYAQQGAGSLPGIFDELKHIFSEGLQKDVNHEEIICSILEVACNFYGANWCGALNADLPLGVWAPVYWYDAETGKMAPTLFYDYESSTELIVHGTFYQSIIICESGFLSSSAKTLLRSKFQ